MLDRHLVVEYGVFSVEGSPPQPQALRVTLVYRRDDGDWRLVHRHADPGPEGTPGPGRAAVPV